MNEKNMVEIQKRIYKLLSIIPGLTLNRIVELLNLDKTIAQSNLELMEKSGEIKSENFGYNIQYFLKKERKSSREKRSDEIRRNIYEILLKNPGLNLTTIAEKLDMSPQLAEYHIIYLEKNDFLTAIKEKGGYYRRYYLKTSEIGINEKKIIALLRQENILQIVLVLLKKPNLKHKTLCEILDIRPSTLSHHLNRLESFNVIEVTTYGREKGYKIKNKKEIISLIRRFVTDIIAEEFNDIWNGFDLEI